MGGKRKSIFKNWLLFVFVLCLTSWTSGPLFAQDTGENVYEDGEEFTLEEVTVTAEKREAELQKIPLDISVVRPDEMDKFGVYNTADLDKILPDVDINETIGANITISIRGVGRAELTLWNAIHETAVAMHLDGVSLTRINGYNNMFYDMQRVEVLKGPQGTLYGRGTIAGSMNMITQKPILGEWSGNVSVEAGNLDMYRAQAALNVPVTEKLALRFAGTRYLRDGFTDSGRSNSNQWGGRVGLTWEPTDKDMITATVDFEGNHNERGYGTNGRYIGVYGPLKIVNHPDPQYDYPPLNWAGDGVDKIELPYQEIWWTTADGAKKGAVKNKSWGTMVQWERDFDFAYGVGLYGHRDLNAANIWIDGSVPGLIALDNSGDYDWEGWPFFGGDPPTDQNIVWGPGPSAGFWGSYCSSEFWRDWMVNQWGVDRFNDTCVASITNTYEGVTLNSLVLDAPEEVTVGSAARTFSRTDELEFRFLSKETIMGGEKYEWVAGINYMDDRITNDSDLGYTQHVYVKTKSYAAFAQLAYEVLPTVNFTAGWRFQRDNKNYVGYEQYGGDASDMWNLPFYEQDPTWREHTYKGNLNWFITQDHMVYFQYSKGYKTGNIDYGGVISPPERMNSFEAGFRTRWFGSRLQVNSTAYFYDYRNYVTTVNGMNACISDQYDGSLATSSNRAVAAVNYITTFKDPQGGVPGDHYCDDVGARYNDYDDDRLVPDGNKPGEWDALFDIDQDGTVDLQWGEGLTQEFLNTWGLDQLGYTEDLSWAPDSRIGNYDYLYTENPRLSPGGAKQFGANINIIWRITNKDTFTFTTSYSKNEYKDYNIMKAILEYYESRGMAEPDSLYRSTTYQYDWSGNEFGASPKRFNLGLTHNEFIGMDMLSFNFRGFYNGEGVEQIMLRDTENEYRLPTNQAYWTVDGSVTYSSSKYVPEGTRWTAVFSVNNIFGSKHLQSVRYTDVSTAYSGVTQYLMTLPERAGTVTGNYISPRTYTLRLSFNF